MQIVTSQLSDDQFLEIINFIHQFFDENKKKEAVVFYGWECNTEYLYEDIHIRSSEIKSFIAASREKSIYILGKSDLYIGDTNGEFEFRLCHESDVHFESKDAKLLDSVKKRWMGEYGVHEKLQGR